MYKRSPITPESSLYGRLARWGCSRFVRNFSRKREASSSSTRRPSLDKVTVISCRVRRTGPSGSWGAKLSSALVLPTAKMQAWGGLMTALNSLIPNIPRLEILKHTNTHMIWATGLIQEVQSLMKHTWTKAMGLCRLQASAGRPRVELHQWWHLLNQAQKSAPVDLTPVE